MRDLKFTLTFIAAFSLFAPNVACSDDKQKSDTTTGTPLVSLAPLVSDPTATKSDPSEQRGQIAESKKPEPKLFPLKFGMDSYSGVSTLTGRRRTSDGMWAGNGPAYPSLGYMRWDSGSGAAAKLAIGTGSLYTGSSSIVEQPVEAWWQVPAGKSALTFGKFWVPFAAQEWQYETKPGVMLQWTGGRTSLAISGNYNTHVHDMNAYMRVGRDLGNEAAVGLSFGYGNGLTYDTIHDKAWGLDATFAAGGFRFFGEYMGAMRNPSDAFGFLYGKLQYEKLGLWKPFVGYYMWNDRSGAFGRFRSSVYGMSFQVTPALALESGISPTSNKRVSWLQLHWVWEK